MIQCFPSVMAEPISFLPLYTFIWLVPVQTILRRAHAPIWEAKSFHSSWLCKQVRQSCCGRVASGGKVGTSCNEYGKSKNLLNCISHLNICLVEQQQLVQVLTCVQERMWFTGLSLRLGACILSWELST